MYLHPGVLGTIWGGCGTFGVKDLVGRNRPLGRGHEHYSPERLLVLSLLWSAGMWGAEISGPDGRLEATFVGTSKREIQNKKQKRLSQGLPQKFMKKSKDAERDRGKLHHHAKKKKAKISFSAAVLWKVTYGPQKSLPKGKPDEARAALPSRQAHSHHEPQSTAGSDDTMTVL